MERERERWDREGRSFFLFWFFFFYSTPYLSYEKWKWRGARAVIRVAYHSASNHHGGVALLLPEGSTAPFFSFFFCFFFPFFLVDDSCFDSSVRPSVVSFMSALSESFFLSSKTKQKNMDVIFILFISLDVPRLPASCRAAVFFEVTELFLLVPRRKWRRTFFYWVFTEFLGGPLSCYRVLGGGTFICFFFINFGTQPKNKTR